MASLHTISPQSLLSLSKPRRSTSKPLTNSSFLNLKFSHSSIFSRNTRKMGNWVLNSVVEEEFDVIPVQSGDFTDQQEGMVVSQVEREGTDLVSQVSGFGANEGRLSFEGFSSATSSSIGDGGSSESEEMEKLVDRTINATIVLAAGTFAITKLLTIDQDYWHVPCCPLDDIVLTDMMARGRSNVYTCTL